jgi:hypothetical protein
MVSVETMVTVDAMVHAAAAYVTASEAVATCSPGLARGIDGKHDRQYGERHR